MANTFTGVVAEIRRDLDKLTERVDALNRGVTGHESALPALHKRISKLERKVAQLEKRQK